MLRILSGCGRRWGDGLGDLGGGDLMEWVGMGRVWLVRVAINTVLGWRWTDGIHGTGEHSLGIDGVGLGIC